MDQGRSKSVADGASGDRDEDQWRHLRELLIGPEQHQLAQVVERLDDPVRRAEELGQALPDAIAIGTSRSDRIARALQPTIDTALKRSAQKDPKALADAIFPALGPAIRKAISAALMGMIQSLNHLLNQSFSLKGLKWRLEAIRSKRSFAEVVLLHTLVYRVEEIFLIHTQSGILLQHVGAEANHAKDPDLVSGMLTAIQEFVKDSFNSQSGEMLDTLRMDGDHSVWIEQGPHAMLAAVIRGIPPLELRKRFRELLDHIHERYEPKLAAFQGQVVAFAMIKTDLEDALSYQAREQSVRLSPLLGLLVAAGVTLGIIGFWHAYSAHRHWMALIEQLRAQRGLVVTMAEKRGGRYFIAGLKDPLARGVEEIIAASQLDPDRIQSQWRPYYALDETTVLERARQILRPPATVTLTLADGILKAGGKAPHQWVKQFRNRAETIPGVQSSDETGLQDEELSAIRSAVADLQQQTIHFRRGQRQIEAAQAQSLAGVVKILQKIESMNHSANIPIKITIFGQTDPSGEKAFNVRLSQWRAQAVMDHLIQHKIDPAGLQAVGITAPVSATESTSSEASIAYRSVTFKASLGVE